MNITNIRKYSIFVQEEEAESRLTKVSRRSIVSAIGASTVLGSSVATARSKPKVPEEQEVLQRLVRQYGKEAGHAGLAILNRHWGEKQRKGLSQEEFHDRVTEALLDHPVASVIAEDVRSGIKDIRRARKKRQEDTRVTESTVQTASSTGVVETTVAERKATQTGTGVAKGEVELSGDIEGSGYPDKINLLSEVTLYGSAKAYVRIYGLFFPDKTGTYNFTADYYRQGITRGGAAKTSAYTKERDGTVNLKTLESPIGDIDGGKSLEKGFGLVGGKTYEVGVEYLTSANSGSGIPLADFSDGSRRFEPNRYGGEKPKLEWRYLG